MTSTKFKKAALQICFLFLKAGNCLSVCTENINSFLLWPELKLPSEFAEMSAQSEEQRYFKTAATHSVFSAFKMNRLS